MPTLLGPELEAKDGELKIPGAVSALDRAAAALDTLTDSVNDLQAEVKKSEEEDTKEVKDVTKADEAKDASDAGAAAENPAEPDAATEEKKDDKQPEVKVEAEGDTRPETEDTQKSATEDVKPVEEGTTADVQPEAEAKGEEPKEEVTEELTEKAVWTTAYINTLPDSAFLYVESGEKDEEGKTVPRSKRHFPIYDADGKLDIPHLRNAIARIPQSNAPGLDDAKKKALQDKARKMLEAAQKSDTKKEDSQTDTKPEQAEINPEQADVNSEQPDAAIDAKSLSDVFKGVAYAALDLAGIIKTNGITAELKKSLGAIRDDIKAISDKCNITKSDEAPLPHIFSEEDIDCDELAKVFADIILDVAGRSASISVIGDDTLADAVRKQIGDVLSITEALEEKAPVMAEKADRVMYDTLMNVVARANVLCEKVSDANGQTARDIKHVQILLKAMTDKYEAAEADLDFADYGLVMEADKTLGALETTLIEKSDKTVAADPPETQADDVDVAKQNKALTDRIEALVGQVNELKAVVAKARGTVLPPASQDEAKPGEAKEVLFPADYNAVECQGATEAQGDDAQEIKLF